MFETFSWWLLLELIGLAAFPIAFRFFRNLPDRGYAFTKPLGLLLIAYPYWLLGTLGFLMNTRATALVVALAVAITSWFVFGRKQKVNTAARLVESELQIASDLAPTAITLETNAKPSRKKRVTRATIRKKRAEQSAAPELLEPTITHYVLRNTSSPIEWLRKNKSLVLATELVFTVAFFAWAFFRAYNPEITATEKPMEFAFLNGILQSDRFPPLDPWLSGFAISYYYFGYVIVALLTMLTGVAASIAFNLAIALLFALSAVGAFGLAYNLIQISEFRLRNENSRNLQSAIRNSQFANFFFPLFAPIFLVVMGNLEGFFETLHARGILPASFWNWLDVKNLASASVSNSFVPS
ncbi:MAG: hypothetical protein HY070_07265, partial [Chloroflexi bacterium]|nr:hypothetical protein [Chloroflexota bacterium]